MIRDSNQFVKRSQRDLSSLLKPLSAFDFSYTPNDGLNMRVSFKGLSGSYSEKAALKAYLNCETFLCTEFEDAFKNSSQGSIHRSYDLLLRHQLHIVGEV